MVFSDPTNESGIVEVARKLVKASADNLTTKDIAAYANNALDDFVTIALRTSGAWQFDERGINYPVVEKDIVKDQLEYTLTDNTVEFLAIDAVEIRNKDGKLIKLKQIDQVDESVSLETALGSGTPKYYDLKYNRIFLYPKPDYDYLNGLRISFSRNVTKFNHTDTNVTPPIPSIFHPYIAYKVAYQYALKENLASLRGLLAYIQQKEQVDIPLYYSNRNRDYRAKITRQRLNYK